MKKIEEGLYKEIYRIINSDLNHIKDYLDGNKTKTINNWINLEIDEKYSILFGNKNITNEEKIAIIEMYRDFTETFASSMLRLFESDLYEIDGYDPGIDRDDYSSQRPGWRGSLVIATDLNGEEITDNTMYENFIGYIEEQKEKNKLEPGN